MHNTYVINTGRPDTSPTPFMESTHDIVTDWNEVLWWVFVPITLAATPVIIVATAITVLYQMYAYDYDLQTVVAMNLVLHELRTPKHALDRKRAEIILHPNLSDVHRKAADVYLEEQTPEFINIANTPDTAFVQIPTEDGVNLDGVQLQPIKNAHTPPESQKWIVYFSGARGTYETNYNSIFEMSQKTGCNILSINYRGIGRSEGLCTSSNELILDGSACIQNLLKRGVRLENILIYGHSLGGGVAAAVARRYPDVNIVIDRSFESYYLAVRAFIWLPFYRDLVSWLVSQWWELNSYENLEHVRGRKWLIVAHQDFIIAHKDASLYHAYIKNQRPPPPSLHLRYEMNPLASCFARVNDLTMTHIYDLPSEEFVSLIRDFLV